MVVLETSVDHPTFNEVVQRQAAFGAGRHSKIQRFDPPAAPPGRDNK